MKDRENTVNIFSIHTDLAVENKEQFEGHDVEISGVKINESYDAKYGVTITKVEICTDDGAKAMNKPKGTYITIEAEDIRTAGYDTG